MKLCFLLLTFLLIVFLQGTARGEDKSAEITFYAGYSFLDAEARAIRCDFRCLLAERVPAQLLPGRVLGIQSSIEDSFVLGFSFGYFINRRMQVEGNFGVAPDHDIRTNVSFMPPLEQGRFGVERSATVYRYDVTFLYHFSETNVRPFVNLGTGGNSTDLDGETETETDLVIIFGGGAKFYYEKLGFRFDVSDRLMPDYFLTRDTEHDLQVRFGLLLPL